MINLLYDDCECHHRMPLDELFSNAVNKQEQRLINIINDDNSCN